MSMTLHRTLLLLFLLLPTLTGCSQPDKQANEAVPAISRHEISNGPIRVTLELSAEKITPADTLQLHLTALAPEEFDIIFPEFSASLGDFTLQETHSLTKELTASGVRHGRIWTLSPFLAGEYAIPAMEIIALKNTGDKSPIVISTPDLTIKVSSFLQPNEKEPELSDIVPPLEVPFSPLYLVFAAGTVLLGIGLLLYLVKRRSCRKTLPPALAAHIIAFEQIDKLLAGSEKTDIPHFFNRLSLILRYYIEAQFGMNAAEQTSEEFLASLHHSSVFSSEQKKVLENFLLQSDLIKFAKRMPTDREAMQSVELCRNFIAATAENAAPEEDARTGGKL